MFGLVASDPTICRLVSLLVTVIDCHTKEVIGWAMDDNYRTPLISAVIEHATYNYRIQPEAIFHSDRGCNTPVPLSPLI